MRKLGGLKQPRARADEINMAPLIDMIFILLIFFVVTTTFVKDLEVDIERPGAVSGQRADRRAIRVAVDRTGSVFVEGRPVRTWMVQARVRALLGQNPERPVLVLADQALPTGRLVRVVDECRLAGAKDVGVDVEKKR
jgi:biopolymer transport protein ExbD